MYNKINLFQNKFNISAMTELREKSRHHAKLKSQARDDIAELLNLPKMDAYKLWNATAHARNSVIKEVFFFLNHKIARIYYTQKL